MTHAQHAWGLHSSVLPNAYSTKQPKTHMLWQSSSLRVKMMLSLHSISSLLSAACLHGES